jgi:pilus assembly protein CpaB
MKPKTIVLMVVAVVCGLAASYMTSRVIAERNHPASGGEEEKVTILVAKQKLPFGTLIKDPKKYFVEKLFTKGEEPKKAIKSWEQVQDKRLNKPLSEDQFVTGEDLLDPKTSGGLDGVLPTGMRAVALKVNVASVVAGFVLPNSRVDLVQTVRHGDQSSVQTVLQNMLVLASDTMRDRPEDKQANVASTVTLAAKPEDVQKIRLAEASGELSLALRGAEDQEIVAIKETRPADLARNRGSDGGPDDGTGSSGGGIVKAVPDAPALSPTATTPAPKAEEPPPPPKTITQIIYNGESVTKTVYVVDKGEVSTQVEKTGMEREPRPEKKEAATKPEKAEPEKPQPEKAQPDKPEPGAKKGADPAAKPQGAK